MFSPSPTDVPAKVRVEQRKLKGKAYIAEGGFSHVFSVKDTKTKEYFALKRMTCQDQRQLAHAIEEVAVMKRLPAHENIVELEGVEISHNDKGVSTVDVLMQIMKGGRLIDVMKARSKHFSMPEILDIFMCIVSATEHLHSQDPPIAHRDLKIENVLLEEGTGIYKVCDFGSCTTIRTCCNTDADVAALKADIELNTTCTYRAPEMLNLHIGSVVGIEADIWALGCTLYKIAYFKDAFTDEHAIINGNFSIPQDPAYPSALHHLLNLCLNVNMSARPNIEILVEHVAMLRATAWTDPTFSKEGSTPLSAPLLPPSSAAPAAHSASPPGAAPEDQHPAQPPKAGTKPVIELRKPELPATDLSHSNASDSSNHRRAQSMVNPPRVADALKPALKKQSSKSADDGGIYTPGTFRTSSDRQVQSDGARFALTKQQAAVEQLNQLNAEMAAIAEQELALKQRRRSLEAELVQLYERNPDLKDLSTRGLVAPVSAVPPAQVEVASFFAGEHARSKSFSAGTIRNAQPDRGPVTPTSNEASGSWPTVVLSLDDVDLPSDPSADDRSECSQPSETLVAASLEAQVAEPVSPTAIGRKLSWNNPFAPNASNTFDSTVPAPSSSSTATRPSHRRSASLSGARVSIRPAQQQSDKKSQVSAQENIPRLPPPPPAKTRQRSNLVE